MSKKYELIPTQTVAISGEPLFRVRAIRDFGKVKAGTVGGFVAKEENLSHEGTCWIGGDAKVYENACVSSSARLSGSCRVYGNAKIQSSARVSDEADISGEVCLSGKSWASGSALLSGDLFIYYNTRIKNGVIAGAK